MHTSVKIRKTILNLSITYLDTLFGGKIGTLFSKISDGYAVNGGGDKPVKLSIEETVRRWNLPEQIRLFLERGTVFSVELNGGYSLKVMVSDAPYSDCNFMVALVNEKDYLNTDSNEAAIVHEAPEKISEAYWECCLQIMRYFSNNADDLNVDEWFIIENTCREVSGSMRVPRSIKFIHAQVGAFAKKALKEVEENKLNQDGLTEERVLWEKIRAEFVKRINETGEHEFQLNLSNYPQGYNLTLKKLPITGDLRTYAALVNNVLRKHHQVYASIIGEFTQNLGNARPQPSYVTYITIRNDELVITISPVIVSYAGGLDAAGIITARTPDVPSRYESIDQRRKEARETVPTILGEQ